MTRNDAPASVEAVLEVRDLKTTFRTSEGMARAVDGISFQIRSGETYALVGESGCGKSVTALSIMQLVRGPAGKVAGGSILYKGRDIVHLPEVEKRRLRGNEISMIFQEPMTCLNPVFTVGQQIMEVLRIHRKLDRPVAAKKAVEMLDTVRVPDPAMRFGQYPHQLSGGMKQRVMIAMALSCRPGLLIADEPTTALDVTIQEEILCLIRELRKTMGAAVLLITHDLGVVAENAERVGVMYAGRIVEDGPMGDVLRNPLHPYTERLLESIPSARKRGGALQTIEGRVPPATRFPPGCRFADRCWRVMPVCRRIDPAQIHARHGHSVACLLYDPDRAGTAIDVRGTQEKQGARVPLRKERTDAPLISVEGLKVWFPVRRGLLRRTVGHVRAVDGTDMNIHKGTTMALVGESGCGKSTFGKAVLRLIHPTAGKVTYGGADLSTLSRRAMRPYRRKLQIVFQDPFSSLDPRMMVGGILTEGMAIHRIGRNRREREAMAAALMEKVGLDPRMIHRYPHEFSGGQRQRIAIARCLAVDPEFIVCDEATSSLDVSVQAQILNLLRDLQSEMSLTYLLITHDLSVVEYLADEVAVMYLGRIVELGAADEILRDPLHPYTRALLSAVPRIDPADGVRRVRLSGDVPSPINPPPGCHFHPRCPNATERCSLEYPPMSSPAAGRACACWLSEGWGAFRLVT